MAERTLKVICETEMRARGALWYAGRVLILNVFACVGLWMKLWAWPIFLLLISLAYAIIITLGAYWGTWEKR